MKTFPFTIATEGKGIARIDYITLSQKDISTLEVYNVKTKWKTMENNSKLIWQLS